MTYAGGPPLRLDHVRGAFVLLVEPARHPRAVIALDASGHQTERVLVDDTDHDGPRIDWNQYRH